MGTHLPSKSRPDPTIIAALRVFLELQAGGYAGSTYELTYDPASDRLKGIHYQAIAKQKYEVYFARK